MVCVLPNKGIQPTEHSTVKDPEAWTHAHAPIEDTRCQGLFFLLNSKDKEEGVPFVCRTIECNWRLRPCPLTHPVARTLRIREHGIFSQFYSTHLHFHSHKVELQLTSPLYYIIFYLLLVTTCSDVVHTVRIVPSTGERMESPVFVLPKSSRSWLFWEGVCMDSKPFLTWCVL